MTSFDDSRRGRSPSDCASRASHEESALSLLRGKFGTKPALKNTSDRVEALPLSEPAGSTSPPPPKDLGQTASFGDPLKGVLIPIFSSLLSAQVYFVRGEDERAIAERKYPDVVCYTLDELELMTSLHWTPEYLAVIHPFKDMFGGALTNEELEPPLAVGAAWRFPAKRSTDYYRPSAYATRRNQ